MRDSWSSGPYSTSQTVSHPNKQTMKIPQTSSLFQPWAERARAANPHWLYYHREFSSSLLHSSKAWATYSRWPPGSRQHSSLPLRTPYRCGWLKPALTWWFTSFAKAKNRHISLSSTSEQRIRRICFSSYISFLNLNLIDMDCCNERTFKIKKNKSPFYSEHYHANINITFLV